MLNQREEGIAGFFEDIPVLLVVTIATGIFLVSLVSAYVNYLDHMKDHNMHDNAADFSQALRGYDELIYDFQEGVFEGEKLISLEDENLQNDFNESTLGYHYQVAIIDTSDYPDSNNYTTSFGNLNPPVNENKYTVTTSILIKVDERYHAAQMIVTIWN
jgi:trans-2-enoyl-CoA reductase